MNEIEKLSKIVEKIKEPAFIVLNVGEDCYFVGNKAMQKESTLQKSSAFHMCVGEMAEQLTEYEPPFTYEKISFE